MREGCTNLLTFQIFFGQHNRERKLPTISLEKELQNTIKI